ncbi:MAG: hypothetical protein ACSHX4_10595 [Opitutaceae bacterium]
MGSQDEFLAVVDFKRDLGIYAKDWPEIAADLNETCDIKPPLSADGFASFEFFLAILFVQSRAPYNIYGDEVGERIWTYLKNTFSVEPDYGSYANEALDHYTKVWGEYLGRKCNPFGGVASVLLHRLGRSEEEIESIVLGTVVMDVLALSPQWWKDFSGENELTKSDMPLNSEEFKRFVDENI